MAALALLRPAEQIEMPLIAVLARMESRGIRLDRSRLARMKTELGAEAGVLRADIVRLAGVEFNPDSPKQLGEVLFERLKLPRGRKTRTGYSTDSSVLERLAARHEVCREVLRYRELTKLCRTYLGPLPAAIDERTGRVHATLEQTGTATGRLSSLEPNLQNIPARTAAGQLVRQAFVPEPGNVFVSADYSQIELRVLAHLARDAVLTSAFEQGEDVHRTTAALVLGVDRDSVVPEQRRLAKVINYGIVYGMGERNLAVQTGLAVEQAREFLDAYLARFQGVAQWRDRVVEQARAEGLVRTIAGRIRPVPGVADRNRVVAEASKRAAINAPVQGSAADIVKVAMLGIERGMNDAGHAPGMILQVHDELLFEVPEPAAGEVAELVKHEMENAWALAVPLVADVRTGANWAEAHRS
jgi:DNA polymerase-1